MYGVRPRINSDRCRKNRCDACEVSLSSLIRLPLVRVSKYGDLAEQVLSLTGPTTEQVSSWAGDVHDHALALLNESLTPTLGRQRSDDVVRSMVLTIVHVSTFV